MKVTIAETGLPGSPNTSRPAGRGPEVGGLAGPQGDAPEDLLDAELRERRTDVVVLADRDAAGDHGDLAGESALERGPGAARVVGHDLRGAPAARPLRSTRAASECRLELRIPPGPQRLAGLLELVAGGQHGHGGRGSRTRPRRARPRPARRPPPARPASRRPARASPAAMSSPARRMSLPGPTSTRTATVSPPPSVSSTLDHRVGAGRDHRAGRDLDRLARAQLARPRDGRLATRRPPPAPPGLASVAPAVSAARSA